MKVLITGGRGQVGSVVLQTAPADKACVAPTRAEMDLAEPQSIRAALDRWRPDVVINSAAWTDVEGAEDHRDEVMQVNAVAPGIIAEWLRKSGGRMVQLSTDYIFDGEASEPYHPLAPRNPISVYGHSKVEGEDAAGADAIILRISWVYSAGRPSFVRTMLDLMRKGDPIRVVDDQIGAPSWAPEVARTIWALIATGQPGIYHHHDAGSVSRLDFAKAIGEEAQALGWIAAAPELTPVSSAQFPSKARRPAYSVLDDSSTRALLGDQVGHWRANLRRMLEEEKALA